METYAVFKSLAIILVAAKLFGILANKLKAPQVVGEIIAGLVIGPSILGLVNQSEYLAVMAEIGIVLLMFGAGLETDLKDLIKSGPKAFLIACMGVFIPLVGGSLLYMAFYGMSPWGSEGFLKAVFIGVILTATSVSITVQTLKELGKLKGTVGTTIVSAAIIDDVIGIIVLTFVIGFKTPK
jgi:Kef-type K+ transport system membrane component KefB